MASNLDFKEGVVAIVLALVKRLGGEVTLTQEEIDANVGQTLSEHSIDGTSCTFKANPTDD